MPLAATVSYMFHLFIIDGSKALRAAINAVFGADTPIQKMLRRSSQSCHVRRKERSALRSNRGACFRWIVPMVGYCKALRAYPVASA